MEKSGSRPLWRGDTPKIHPQLLDTEATWHCEDCYECLVLGGEPGRKMVARGRDRGASIKRVRVYARKKENQKPVKKNIHFIDAMPCPLFATVYILIRRLEKLVIPYRSWLCIFAKAGCTLSVLVLTRNQNDQSGLHSRLFGPNDGTDRGRSGSGNPRPEGQGNP